MRQRTVRSIQVFVVSLLLVYVADWGLLRLRIARGTAFRTVQVHQLLATPLKGQKEEYDYLGDASVTCSRSLFPQAGNLPCWWLARHTTQWQ